MLHRFFVRTYSWLKESLPRPHRGHTQSSGRSSKAVPAAMPLSGSPTAGSYTYPQASHTYLAMFVSSLLFYISSCTISDTRYCVISIAVPILFVNRKIQGKDPNTVPTYNHEQYPTGVPDGRRNGSTAASKPTPVLDEQIPVVFEKRLLSFRLHAKGF